MKIALVHMRHARTGGTERYLNHVAKHLCERGDEVSIVCRSHEDPPHPKARFVVLKSFAIGGAGRMKAFARDVETHVAAGGYDLVYGLGKTYTHDVVRLGGGCHATYLAQAHESTLSPWEKRLGLGKAKHAAALEFEKRALARDHYQLVVVNSELVGKDAMQRHAIYPERIRLVYNGVDLERFHPKHRATLGAALRKQLGFADKDFVVLFLGTGYGRKGLDRLLKVVPEVMASRPDVRLVVVGFDSRQKEFEAQAAALGLADKTRFLGGREDTQACYAASDLYVLPTRYDPFANSTLEAMASGLPVITTTLNGACELIDEGQSGIALYGDDIRQTLYKDMLAWTRPERARAGGLRSREIAERHSAHSKMEESAAVLDEALAMKRGAR